MTDNFFVFTLQGLIKQKNLCNFAYYYGTITFYRLRAKTLRHSRNRPLRIVANGLTTVPTSTLIDFVKQYIATEGVDRIIVGLPTTMRGEPSESMRYLTPVINRLKKEIAPIEVTFFDERFTSAIAHRAMIDGGMKRWTAATRQSLTKSRPRYS